MSDPIRDALQQHLDECGDGWSVRDYVVSLGLERVLADGGIETATYWIAPREQAEYVTDGLFRSAWDDRVNSQPDD